MPESFGPGVSRTLSALARQFAAVVWQADKPPLDSELNLMSQMEWENLSQMVRAQVHSGFYLDPTRCEADYVTDPLNANQFLITPPVDVLGNVEDSSPLYAVVNGWVIPVAGTSMPEGGGADTTANRVRLYPPPTTDARTDLVFVEVWRTLVSPTPSTVNKPSSTDLWRYGNTLYGGTNVPDQMEDPSIGFETTKRVQLQYRIRVVGSGDSAGVSIDLVTYPDGLTDPQVLAQGTAASPLGGFTFANMRDQLGDPSLWRAGDGAPTNALGTIDGYVYAIPICGVFRRNTAAFTAIATGGNPNQNGADERTPSSHGLVDPLAGARLLGQATLASSLSETLTGWVTLNNYSASALNDPNMFPVGVLRRYLVLGSGINREIIAINLNTDPVGHPNDIFIDLAGRGRGGTMARQHPAGTTVSLYNSRPDGLYADQIAPTDILDMRRSVNFGDWDYTRLLQKGISALVQNNLRTAFKQSGTGGDSVGPVTTEVSYFSATVSPPNHVAQVDGANGIRNVWSDSAALQSDVTVILDDQAALNTNNYTTTTFNATIAAQWTVGADFQPNGFMNKGTGPKGWTNGSVVFVDIGGASGLQGARAGILNNQQAVRFLSPKEVWRSGDNEFASHHPWTLRFVGGVSLNAPTAVPPTVDTNAYRAGYMTSPQPTNVSPTYGDNPGPMFPLASANFERPFIVLGGVLNPALRFTGLVATGTLINNIISGQYEIVIPTIDWDTFALTLGRGGNLRGYLSNNGADFTGLSSKIYVVVYGDKDYRDNNGAFQVIGAGTSAVTGGAYTQNVTSNVHRIVVRPLSSDFDDFAASANTVTIEFRSMDINAEDDNGLANPPHGLAVVLTDLQGTNTTRYSNTTPWGDVSQPLEEDGSPAKLVPVASKATLTMDLMWSPNHGSSPRVPDQITRFAVASAPAEFVRTPASVTDSQFIFDTGYPNGTPVYESTQVQLWNRLPSRGIAAPYAPYTSFGGAVVGLTEQDREAELFVDPGSKTVVFRPFTAKTSIMKGFSVVPVPGPTLVGTSDYPNLNPKNALGIFVSSMTAAYAVPPEFMPRFGRQDIPYHVRTGTTDPVYPGINHLFADGPTATDQVFYIIGGLDNGSAPGVLSVLMNTLTSTLNPNNYGTNVTVGGLAHGGYAARKVTLTDVVSSDLGVGLKGIELPPYLGIARLYGVYEQSNFVATMVGNGNVGAFQNSDRITPINNPPVNLLREDATKQTLFIRQGGANTFTNQSDSHTYIVPDTAFDITRIPGYLSGQTFNDFDYVVECVVFGYGEGFINKNNWVLARFHAGNGATVTNATNQELAGGVEMILPFAAPSGSVPYEVYSRTVYQGNPLQTSSTGVLQSADYGSRYGQIPQGSAYYVGEPINQSVVQTPNPRAVEVLATMDFYTTLGTGKIGGQMYNDTVLDCGYIDPNSLNTNGDSRIPNGPLQLPWRVLPRAFTAGQNTDLATDPYADVRTYGAATFQVLDYNIATTNSLTVTLYAEGMPLSVTLTPVGVFVDNTAYASDLASLINGNTNLSPYFSASANGAVVHITLRSPGNILAAISLQFTTSFTGNISDAAFVQSGNSPPCTSVLFVGGRNIPANAGNGNSVISLTGMTERLPLGILVSDSDFLAENLLGDGATSLRSYQGSLRAVYETLPLTTGGAEYNRFLGEPGSLLSMTDGAVLQYIPYTGATPAGSKVFRIFRGGGAGFVLSGVAPGGPVTWVADSFGAASQPVLKGAVLACKAVLVRNYHEVASLTTRSEGDEIQMVVFTQAVYGKTRTTLDGVVLTGLNSPTGYGEGYSAVDRYRLPGLPMDRGRTRSVPNPAIPPAPYNP